PYARSALFREAIDAVMAAEGPQLLWRRTAPLRVHSASARAAQARGDSTAQLAAERMHREAQVGFMAYALGDARIDDVAHQVRNAVSEARVRVDALRAAGHNVTRAAALVQDAEVLLAGGASQPVDVLSAALEAADILDRLDQILRSVERLPSLDELFAAAIAGVRNAAGPRAARALLAEHQTLVREAQSALANGGRVRAHDRLQEVRERPVRIIAQRIGAVGVRQHVDAIVAAEKALSGSPDERRRVGARAGFGCPRGDSARSAFASPWTRSVRRRGRCPAHRTGGVVLSRATPSNRPRARSLAATSPGRSSARRSPPRSSTPWLQSRA